MICIWSSSDYFINPVQFLWSTGWREIENRQIHCCLLFWNMQNVPAEFHQGIVQVSEPLRFGKRCELCKFITDLWKNILNAAEHHVRSVRSNSVGLEIEDEHRDKECGVLERSYWLCSVIILGVMLARQRYSLKVWAKKTQYILLSFYVYLLYAFVLSSSHHMNFFQEHFQECVFSALEKPAAYRGVKVWVSFLFQL